MIRTTLALLALTGILTAQSSSTYGLACRGAKHYYRGEPRLCFVRDKCVVDFELRFDAPKPLAPVAAFVFVGTPHAIAVPPCVSYCTAAIALPVAINWDATLQRWWGSTGLPLVSPTGNLLGMTLHSQNVLVDASGVVTLTNGGRFTVGPKK